MTSIDLSPRHAAARWLLSAAAVRDQAERLMTACERGELAHFAYDGEQLDWTADYVAGVIAASYPDLAVPPHARWRHFVIDGDDRWQRLARTLADDPLERARSRIDLAVTSVLLDAGAGPDWSYRDITTGKLLRRSEGLAIASLEMFAGGLFSADDSRPLRADAATLADITAADLACGFTAGRDNPLVGLDGRAGLLNRLGHAAASRPDLFGAPARIGHLADALLSRARDGTIAAPDVLAMLLDALGPIWPGRLELAGLPLGDCWQHPAARRDDAASGYVPFHKLSQWLTYSLIEPLDELGLVVTDLDGLTGLAEYRNGGLMIDAGLLVARHRGIIGAAHEPGSEIVVEWRALTIALLDRLAEAVRRRLGLDRARLPLAAVLEGGTWAAGRKLAAERRCGGGPPIEIVSDGSVF